MSQELKTADELVAEGRRLSAFGNFVAFLYPSQEWMAVQTQMPFLRYEMCPNRANEQTLAGASDAKG